MLVRVTLSALLAAFALLSGGVTPATALPQEDNELREWNHHIRREKFDLVLPEIMRKHGVDMWIHVMREAIPDPFGAEDLGSTSGV
ncbi:MAG: hypothetical protein PVJ51_00860, partial [Acidobacteriota bacterium]